MKTAIVILNWNGKKLLEQFLPSIVNFSSEASIYVADNASTDTSISYVRTFFPSIKIVKNATNGGYAKGYNDALQSIHADIFCLINSDVAVTKNWLVPVLDVFKNEEKTAIIQPKILDFKDKRKFEYAGAGGGFVDLYGYPYCRGRIFNHLETDKGQFNNTTDIFWASGACLFIRSKIYHQLNGFDEDYFAHQEEIDLCWRIHNAGYKIAVIPDSTVFHLGGGTLDYGNSKKVYLNFRNNLYTLFKNDSSINIFWKIPLRLILDGIAGLKFLLEGKFKSALSIIKAHFSFYANFFKLLKKRSQLEELIKVYGKSKANKDGMLSKSILWQYYVSGKKTFSDIFKTTKV